MGKCKFNLDIKLNGIGAKKYKIIKLGDKYAKIREIYEKGNNYVLVLESRHKNRDFIMFIETIWKLPKKRKTFRIVSDVVSIDLFGIDWSILVIPNSHINTLAKWYDELIR